MESCELLLLILVIFVRFVDLIYSPIMLLVMTKLFYRGFCKFLSGNRMAIECV